MFRIADGREYFYQWDLDRQVIVEDPSIVEVHFCNRTDECSLVVDVVNGLANVPNLILQKSFDVRVFGYDGKATRYDKVFKVKPRTKPADYVYTETEIKNYDELKERVDEIEKNGVSQEAINTAVGKYLEENPLGEIPTKVSQLENDSNFITRVPDEYITETKLNAKGYATKTYVDEAIAGIDIPEGGGGSSDLSNYYTKEETDLAIQNSKDAYYLDFSNAAQEAKSATEDMIEFATRCMEAQNVCAYVQENTSITHGWHPVTIKKLRNGVTLTPSRIGPEYTKNNVQQTYPTYKIYQSGEEWAYIIDSYYTYALATTDYVDNAIANIDIPESGGGGGSADLTDYYTKEETDALLDNINECDTYFFNPYEVEWQTGLTLTPPPSGLLEFAQRLLAGDRVNLYIAHEVVNSIRWVPAEFTISSNQVLVWRSIALTDVGTEAEYLSYKVFENAGTWRIVKNTAITTKFIADKTYVDNAIANINIPEGGSTSIYELVLPAAGEIITDTKTVELLDNALFNDVVPLCSYQGKLITDLRKNSQTIYLTCIKQTVLSEGFFTEYDLTFVHYGDGSWKFSRVTETSRQYISKTSQLENDSDFTTKAYVDEAIEAVKYATEIYRLVKPSSEPTEDPADGNKVLITDAHTIEYLNRVFDGEAVLGYTWKISLKNHLLTETLKTNKRLTLRAHRLFASSTGSSITHYTFYMDKADDGSWYWVGHSTEDYDIQKAAEATVQTALNNIGVAEGGSY